MNDRGAIRKHHNPLFSLNPPDMFLGLAKEDCSVMFEAGGKGWVALLTLLVFLAGGGLEQEGTLIREGPDAFDKSLT